MLVVVQSRLQKRWIDTVKECLSERGLDVMQPRRMVQDRNEWWWFVRGNAWGIAHGMNSDHDEMPQLYEVCLWSNLQLKGYKGENFFSFLSFITLLL